MSEQDDDPLASAIENYNAFVTALGGDPDDDDAFEEFLGGLTPDEEREFDELLAAVGRQYDVLLNAKVELPPDWLDRLRTPLDSVVFTVSTPRNGLFQQPARRVFVLESALAKLCECTS
jgi:hypothetical protein